MACKILVARVGNANENTILVLNAHVQVNLGFLGLACSIFQVGLEHRLSLEVDVASSTAEVAIIPGEAAVLVSKHGVKVDPGWLVLAVLRLALSDQLVALDVNVSGSLGERHNDQIGSRCYGLSCDCNDMLRG
jgi:hypothetical protein